MTALKTERLILRNWQERDRDLFHRINSEDTVMEFFPMRRSRAQSDRVMDEMQAEISADGYGWTAAEIAATGECIGFIGLHAAEIEPEVPAGSLEIGWRLAPEFWGKGFVTEGALALRDHAFAHLGQDGIYSFAVIANRRSTAVMQRLGMTLLREFIHPEVPDTHPHLQRHALFQLTREAWARLEKN